MLQIETPPEYRCSKLERERSTKPVLGLAIAATAIVLLLWTGFLTWLGYRFVLWLVEMIL